VATPRFRGGAPLPQDLLAQLAHDRPGTWFFPAVLVATLLFMAILTNLSSGLWGLIIGALLGLALSVLFEEPLVRLRGQLVRRVRSIRRIREPLYRDAFTLGPLQTSMLIVEGDGENVIHEEMVRVIVAEEMIQLPAELLAWKAEVANREEARRVAGEPFLWNGESYAVKGFVASRRPDDECPEVTLHLEFADYYTFLATQQLDRRFADGTTPRSRYVEGVPPERVPSFMAGSFGTNVAVVTSDRQVVFCRRSANVGSNPDLWSSSANEAISRSIDSSGRISPNVYNVARRGLKEELAIEPGEYHIRLLAFAIDTNLHQWGALFVAEMHDVTAAALSDRWSRGIADRFEHVEKTFVPFNPEAVLSFILAPDRRNCWTAVGPPLFYLALINVFGRSTVERGLGKVVRRLNRGH
jgi:hypothetical protein